MEGPCGTKDLSLSPETLSDPESHPPRALTPIPEPLLHGPRRASTSSIASANASASNAPSQHAHPLHVQFDPQSLPAPLPISSASTSSSNDKERSIANVKPPDGGWGWLIVFAAFMINLVAGGITFTFQLFFSHFLDFFGGSTEKTVWILRIFMAMPLLFGPIATFLIDRYGCRRMTILGSFLAAIGFVISAFVDNIETLMFTFGIMAGFGLSLCYVAAVVIVAYYFEKKRSLATGISVCGSRIGTFIFASFTNDWLDKYKWQGTSLIFAGLLLNMAVCGLLFRDLPWMATMNEEKAKERQGRRERKRNKLFGPSKVTDVVDIKAVTTSLVPQNSSLVDLATYMTEGEGVSLETLEQTRSPANAILAENYPGTSQSFSENERLDEMSPSKTLMSPGMTSPRKLSPDNALPSALKTNGKKRLTSSSFWKQVQWYAGLCWDLTVDILDFSLFLNPGFLVFVVSNVLLHMWYNVPYIYIGYIGFSKSLNMSQISMLISIVGILNIFGEIFFGWISDWECLNPILVYAVCMILGGLVTVVVPLLTTFLGLAAASGAFGAFLATKYCLTSNILVKQITLKKFTNAYGLLLFIQGLANFIGPLLTVWVSDIANSYDLLFYLAGVFIGLSGLILIVSPLSNAARRRRHNDHRHVC